MSDPRSKKEQSKAKDIRQGVTGQPDRSQTSHPGKKARPWKVMAKAGAFERIIGKKEFCVHASQTRRMAEDWIAKEARSGHSSSEDYWIEGPDNGNAGM